MSGVATAIAGAAVVGGVASMSAANKQAGAAQNAQNIAQSQFQTNVGLQQPYNQAGMGALSQLNYLQGIGPQTDANGNPPTGVSNAAGGYGSLNAPFTAQTFQQYSPAYQFQLQQGQQGVLNQDATGSGALSGAALKDLTSFNQGLANTSFNTAFNQYQTQQSNTYNRLANIANLGQSAASGTAQSGTALAGTAASAAQNVGTAQAGGIVGASNALGTGGTNAALWAQYGGGGGGYSNTGVGTGVGLATPQFSTETMPTNIQVAG
jgi:hypothetical protein